MLPKFDHTSIDIEILLLPNLASRFCYISQPTSTVVCGIIRVILLNVSVSTSPVSKSIEVLTFDQCLGTDSYGSCTLLHMSVCNCTLYARRYTQPHANARQCTLETRQCTPIHVRCTPMHANARQTHANARQCTLESKMHAITCTEPHNPKLEIAIVVAEICCCLKSLIKFFMSHGSGSCYIAYLHTMLIDLNRDY
jgi:hypothetical protein